MLTTTSASSIVSTASATTTTHFTFISGSQKICLPRPFFTRDARAVTGSASALQSGNGYAASSGGVGVFSSSYFTPPARIRRITAGVSSSSRLGGVSGAGGVNVPGGGTVNVYAALNNPHLHSKYAVSTIGKPSVSGTVSANAMPSAQRQVSVRGCDFSATCFSLLCTTVFMSYYRFLCAILSVVDLFLTRFKFRSICLLYQLAFAL